MPWQQAAQAQPPRPATPVPGGESVRLTALQATWKRDRQVARRRLWWRWTVWGAQRYVLPLAAGLSMFAGLWFGVRATMSWWEAPSLSNQPVASVTTKPSPSTAAPDTPPTASESQTSRHKPLPPKAMITPSGVTMAFEMALTTPSGRAHQSNQSPVSSAALPEAAKIPNPQLISENWLHSKEP